MSGGSRNKIPLVGNTGGAFPCVRVLNHPAPGREAQGYVWYDQSNVGQKAFRS